ncbi:hypothetical protein RF55_24190, partial [Lasius niger]
MSNRSSISRSSRSRSRSSRSSRISRSNLNTKLPVGKKVDAGDHIENAVVAEEHVEEEVEEDVEDVGQTQLLLIC